MGCHFSAHHCCNLLLISKWKPYFKNIHVCQAFWKKELWQFATKTHTGTRNQRQQNASAVLLGRPRQVETESEEEGDKAHAGCSRSLPQGWAGTSRAKQCGNRDFTKASQAHKGETWELLHTTGDFPPCPAHSRQLEGLLLGWTRPQGDVCKQRIVTVPRPLLVPPQLHPQSPRATTTAWQGGGMLCRRAAMGAGTHPPHPAPSQARQWN